jgi:hypothetical protein
MPMTKAKSDPDYKVGYGRPPVEYQFKPGQRANSDGRPRGSQNVKTVVRRVLTKKISVRRGDKTHKASIIEAITEAHALKAAQGDHRSAGVVINLAGKTGLLNANAEQLGGVAKEEVVAKANECPADALIEGIDPNLLSEEEQIDLSRIADLIDRGGDVMTLLGTDFERLKLIVNKGRGKDVTPKNDATPDTST